MNDSVNQQIELHKTEKNFSNISVIGYWGRLLFVFCYSYYNKHIKESKWDKPMIKKIFLNLCYFSRILSGIGGQDKYRDQNGKSQTMSRYITARLLLHCIALLLMFIIPLLYCFIIFGNSLPHYNNILLNYIYPIAAFFRINYFCLGTFVFITIVIGYVVILAIIIENKIHLLLHIANPGTMLCHLKINTAKLKIKSIALIIGYISLAPTYYLLYSAAKHELSSKKATSYIKLCVTKELRNELAHKTISLSNLSLSLSTAIVNAANNTKAICEKNKYHEFSQAKKDQTVINELKIIQKAQIYKTFTEKQQKIASASVDKLEGIEKQLELDITLLTELEEQQIETLINQVSIAIEDIEPNAEDLVIDKSAKRMPMEDIWKEYIQPAIERRP